MGSAQPIGALTVSGRACVIIVERQTKNIGCKCAAAAAAAGGFEAVSKSLLKACVVSGFVSSSEGTQ